MFPSRFIVFSFILKSIIWLQTARSSQILSHISIQNNIVVFGFTVAIVYQNWSIRSSVLENSFTL